MDPGFTDDPVAVYLWALREIPPLTAEEEEDLSEHVWANDSDAESAGKRLVEANLGMVIPIAERYRDRGVHFLDLVIAGNNGLLIALRQFANQPGTRFSDHTTACVEAAIAEAVEG